ncbi:translocation and assembly module TamA [Bathymodiolus japonicus methanotrophic gill symbiont]|uniref:autotransporter assembly complex protein TamA n=1 Tax=Bathymodiolus japonicus methanotrophic gill symbiont TaxID=113269 RepID=UPI001B608898|nr:autotransporter assembly complex family protein [Bathymodiolus japonicus methanotrophic gill symbiont]GFO72038.1 translocation and assembly module TamA [Bathymodiolus japonicus methanotrophic gill symbiont]
MGNFSYKDYPDVKKDSLINSRYLDFFGFCTLLVLLLSLVYSNRLYAEPEIEITGLTSEQEDNVRAYLSLTDESCNALQWKIKRLYTQAPLQIKKALRALGYYHPKITKTLDWEEGCWQSSLLIVPGPPMIIDAIDVQVLGPGAEELFFSEILRNISIKVGDIVNHGEYDKLKRQLKNRADAKGYFDKVFVLKRLSVNPDTNTARLQLHMQTGSRYYISRIDVEKSALHTDFSSKYLTVKQGQAYDRARIFESHQLLDTSGYFRGVELKYEQSHALDYQAPLTVKLSNLPRHAMSAGVGYDTDLGFRLSAGYRNRYLNDSGQQFVSDLNLSLKKSNLLMEYIIPLSNPLKDRLSFFAGLSYENTVNVNSGKLDVGLRLSNRFYGQFILAEQLKFVAERFRNSNTEPFQTQLLLVPGISISNVRAMKKGNYLEGYKYMLEFNGAHRSVGSSVSFIQTKLHIKGAYPTFLGGRILARIDLGATAVDNFEDLPTSYRFYAGGDNSVRGYDYKSIGQRDAAGEVSGGQFLTTASLEYEQRIYGNWTLAAFVDAGDAFTRDLDIQIGVGLGVRWYSLVGPVRIDIAVPSEDFGDVHVHFSLSTAL